MTGRFSLLERLKFSFDYGREENRNVSDNDNSVRS